MAKLLKGKPVADAIIADARARADALRARGVAPTLAIVRVGSDPGDLSYERTLLKRASDAGVGVQTVSLDADVSQDVLGVVMRALSDDPAVHGCLMFRPLPAHLDDAAACELIAPVKDVDGVTRASLAYVVSGAGEGFAPSTAEACLRLLRHYDFPISGARVAVLGRSLVVGRPLALLLTACDATVTLCHSRTKDTASICRDADIVVCATGSARAFGREYFRDGQTVLDVGINFTDEGEMCGDVDESELDGVACAHTPVPGGIGSVTTAVTLDHVVVAAERAAHSVRGRA